MVLAKKVKQMKTNYSRTMQNNTAANNNNMYGNMNAANNPLNNMAGMGGNPMQNILLQSLLNGGGNGMNMCGNGGGGMC